MSAPTQQADNLYLRTREDLLPFEDSLMNSLLNGTANYYTPRNDQSIWGEILRSVAIELARLDYYYAYDQVNKDPQFLTPPDIKRRWAGPLFISKIYPQASQSDIAYRAMLVELIQAYRQGSTVVGIQEVINAYTGLNIQVLELYKFIGQGFFDISDTNSIDVSINVGGSNPLEDITNLNQLQAITATLAGAIDLAKPAHVGLNLATVFGSDENIDAFIVGIIDTLRIFIQITEAEPFPPQLFLSPDLFPGTPRTGLAPVAGWPTNQYYNRGQSYLLGDSIVDPNGNVQLVTTAGTTYPYWIPNHVYNLGDKIRDLNNFIQQVTVGGTSGATVPPFSGTIGHTTPDNGVTWTNESLFAFNTVLGSAGPTRSDPVFGPTGPGFSDGPLLPASGSPPVATGTTHDGSVVWTNQGPPPGVLAPRINQAWEISGGDTFNGFLLV